MISCFRDHSDMSLLFGVITKSKLLWFITKFHGQKHGSLTLSSAIRKQSYLETPGWLGMLSKVIKALMHAHTFVWCPAQQLKSEQLHLQGPRKQVS